MNAQLFELEDLLDNPTPRVPISLCLDCSGSMSGEPISELNKGVEAFYKELNRDEIARYSAEISIVTFGPVKQETGFQTLDQNHHPPVLSTDRGCTPMGEALKLSLDTLEDRKGEYQRNGVDYYQPWLIFMTDGTPYGGDLGLLDQQLERVRSLVMAKKLSVFPIAIGEDASMQVLSQMSPNRSPLKLKGLKFAEFFSWLSKSVSRVSQSTPGDRIEFDKEGIKGWAEL